MNAWQALFGWPAGGVYGNFVDDLVCLVIGFMVGHRSLVKLHRKLDRHHREHMRFIGHPDYQEDER